jgi:hypothetical protein
MWRLMTVVALLCSTSAQASEKLIVALSPAITAGIGGLRAGATLDIAALSCRDACGGIGAVFGASDFYRQEYVVGFGLIGMYMGSVLLQGEVRIRDNQLAGFHLTPGIGIFNAFAMLRLGYDDIAHTAVAEIGLTAKIRVSGW